MNIAEDTRMFDAYDDPYQGVIDYDYLMVMQDSAIEAELAADLTEVE